MTDLRAQEAVAAAATIADVLERLIVDEAVSMRGAAALGDVSGLVDLLLARIESDASTIATLRKALQTTEDRVHRMEDVIAGCETCSAALDEKGE